MMKVTGVLTAMENINSTGDDYCEITLLGVTGREIKVTGLTANEVRQIASSWGANVALTLEGAK